MNNLQRAIDSDYGCMSLPPLPPENEKPKHAGGRPQVHKMPHKIVRYIEYRGKKFYRVSVSYHGKRLANQFSTEEKAEMWAEEKIKELLNE